MPAATSRADQRPEQQQQSTMQASEPASAEAADAHPGPAAGRKPKEPIRFVAPPPKASPDNPNFKPRQAWPDGKYVKILPQKQLPPGQHRWKGSTGAAPHPSQRQPASRLRSNSGNVNMHSAIALELQSAGNGGRGLAGNGYSRLTSNGGGSGSDIDNAPEPGEVPAAARKRISYQPGDGYASRGDGHGAAFGAGSRPPLLADMYAKQLATGGRGLTDGGSGGGSGSPANSGRLRQQQPLTGQYPADSTFDGAIRSGGGFGVAGGRTSSLRRPSAHGSSFAEGYDAAGKTITAAANNQWRLANSRAAVIAALPPGDEGDAARHGFRARIKTAQQEADQTGDAAFVAELEEYLHVALGVAGTADAVGGGRRAVADAADSFSFGVNGSGAFGSSVSVEQGAEAGAGRGGGSGRRNVAVFRRGSREVQVGDGGGSGGGGGGEGGGGDSGVGGSGTVGSFKGSKRKAPWQADGGGKAATTHRKVVSVPAEGGGSGGKPATGKPAFSKPASSKLASAPTQQAPSKKPAAAAAPPPSIGQKLSMSLDAIAGKSAGKSAAKAAAAGGSTAGGAALSSSGKHQPIAWQG